MRTGFFIASLISALVLLGAIVFILSGIHDNRINVPILILAGFICTGHLMALLFHLLHNSQFTTALVKAFGLISSFALLLLAVVDRPVFEVKTIFTTIDSQGIR